MVLCVTGIYIWNLGSELMSEGMLLWGSAAVMLDVCLLWCLCVAGLVVKDSWSELAKRQRRTVTVAVAGLSVAAILSQAIPVLPQDRFMEVLPKEILDIAQSFVRVNNAGVVLAIIALVAAVCLITAEPAEDDPSKLARRIRSFRLTFYSAGTLLGLGVYAVFRLFQWGTELDKTLAPLASSLPMAAGFVFSTLLAVVFLPSALLLAKQRTALMTIAAEQQANFNEKDWSTRHALGSSPLVTLGSYVAVLSPAVTGLLTKMLNV